MRKEIGEGIQHQIKCIQDKTLGIVLGFVQGEGVRREEKKKLTSSVLSSCLEGIVILSFSWEGHTEQQQKVNMAANRTFASHIVKLNHVPTTQ